MTITTEDPGGNPSSREEVRGGRVSLSFRPAVAAEWDLVTIKSYRCADGKYFGILHAKPASVERDGGTTTKKYMAGISWALTCCLLKVTRIFFFLCPCAFSIALSWRPRFPRQIAKWECLHVGAPVTNQVNGCPDGITSDKHGVGGAGGLQKKKKISLHASLAPVNLKITNCRSHTAELYVIGFPLNLLQGVPSGVWIARTVAQVTAEVCSVLLVKTLALYPCL